MSEEEKVVNTGIDDDTPAPEIEAPLMKDTGVEEQARAQGWLPPEEAVEKGVSPDDTVSAQSYLDRGPLMRQIKLLNQRNRTMAQQFDKLQNKVSEAEVQGYEQAVVDLKAQRDEAFDELDNARVRQLDEQIEQHETQKEELIKDQQQQQTFDPETMEFVQANQDWWAKEADTMQFAVNAEKNVKLLNPTMDLDEVYASVQGEVDKFRAAKGRAVTAKEEQKAAPKKDKVSYVAPPRRASTSSGEPDSYSFHDLTSGAKDTYMTMKNYYKDEFGKDYSVDDFVTNQKNAGFTQFEDIVKR